MFYFGLEVMNLKNRLMTIAVREWKIRPIQGYGWITPLYTDSV